MTAVGGANKHKMTFLLVGFIVCLLFSTVLKHFKLCDHNATCSGRVVSSVVFHQAPGNYCYLLTSPALCCLKLARQFNPRASYKFVNDKYL